MRPQSKANRRCGALRAAVGAVGMVVAASLAAVAPAVAAEPPTPAVQYTFDELTAATAGTAIANTGSRGTVLNAAMVNSGATLVDDTHGGSALRFPGGTAGSAAPYAVIPNGAIASGQQDVTITARVRWENTTTGCRYPFTLGDSSTKYLSYLAGCVRAEMKSGSTAVTKQNATIPEGDWTDIAIVLDGGSSFAFYMDGSLVGSVSTAYTASSIATSGASGWLSKSPFTADPYFDGAVDDLTVWSEALTGAQVASVYDTYSDEFVANAVEAVDLGDLSALASDLSLPTTSTDGEVAISWASSAPSAVSDAGEVNRLDTDTTGTLTATFERGSVTQQATYDFTVPATDDPAGANQDAAAAIVLPSVLASGDVLPTAIAGRDIAWSVVSGPTSVADGTVASGPADGLADAVLRATVGAGDIAAQRDIGVRVIEEGNATLAAYTTTKTTRGTDDPELETSVHLALSGDGTSYTALNSGAGVVYASAEGQSESANGVKRGLADPRVFRLAGDDGFGVIARRVNVDGTQTAADARGAILFTTPDLVHFTEVGFLTLSEAVTRAAAEWDAHAGAYRIVWRDADGSVHTATTTDWTTLTPAADARTYEGRLSTIAVANAGEASLIPLTAEEAAALARLLGRVANTGIESPELTIAQGDGFTAPDDVAAEYSDGQTYYLGVTWNPDELAAVDTSTPGTYTVTGEPRWQQTVFPLVSGRADPHMHRYTDPVTGEKTWLFISTDENGQDDFFIREASTVEGIKTAPDNKILGSGLFGRGGQLWAPEFHEVDGDLYVLFAGNVASGGDIANIQAHTMRLKPGQDPLLAASWETPQRVLGTDGGHLATAGLTLTIDMTHLRVGDQDYLVWNQRTKYDANGQPSRSGAWAPAVIKIARADVSSTGAWQITTDPVILSTPGLGWDYNTSPVDEGPFVIRRDGRIMITFSGSGVDETYAVGLLEASADADLTDPASWTKRSYPIWSYEGPIANNWGPGHNAYVLDDDGNLLNVFHAKPTATGARTAGVRMVYFRTDGTPILDMTDAEWLAEANRTVTMTVTVEPASGPDFEATTTTRCAAGKVYLTVSVRNTGDATASFTLSTPYGTRNVSGLEPGAASSAAFNTRTADLPAGTVEVTGTAEAGERTESVDYPALHCG
ncbi:family 43 glycosylhydrolase [Glycomyces luteolus]|uniref:Family 43 glycosylhydrolase n=1 Tax=Glycomyces luteolus TaxID=2670330 RepID=A0A9X3SSD5_9ACTN|nr:family 43 glycosylhydrolase [Glycomyces luteolus]MDA1361094.1 family 43 glycosylhydrolase [Glycomyces luteolus]